MTLDRVRVTGMRFWGKVGATEDERARSQPIDLDVDLAVDCKPSAASDDLADAVDYDRVYHACERLVTEGSFHLLETLADACLRAILVDKRIVLATVRVRKPRFLNGATPEVELTRPAS